MRRLNKSYPPQKQLKNRSSKHLHWLLGPGTKPIVRCVNNTQLSIWGRLNIQGANEEIARRARKAEKKELNESF